MAALGGDKVFSDSDEGVLIVVVKALNALKRKRKVVLKASAVKAKEEVLPGGRFEVC